MPDTQTAPKRAPYIVGFGGAFSHNSQTERLLSAVLHEAGQLGAQTRLFSGRDLATLPHYDPVDSYRTPEQVAFLEAISQADGIVIATPTYHGGISALVKNAIDLVSDLRKDERPYFDGRAVGIVVTAGGGQGAGATLSGVRDIVHALRGWPTPIGVAVNTSVIFDEQGQILSTSLKDAIATQARQLVEFHLLKREAIREDISAAV